MNHCALSIKHYALCITTLLLLSSCSSSSDRFRLEGRFRNMNQGELYIYDAERGTKDTIRVRDGRFEYQRNLEDTAMLMLMFPNFSELPIIAHPSSKITIKGDVSHLRETKVSGDKANEELTNFRLDVAEQTPPEQRKTAEDFIINNASSPISLYLVQRFFVQNESPDYEKAHELCTLVAQKQPNNIKAKRLLNELQLLKNYKTEGPLPSFHARDTKGRLVDNSTLKSDVNVILVWSSWNYESQNMVRTVRRREQAHQGRMSVITICLDANKNEGKGVLERDSISWPNVCDGKMWESPLLTQLGVSTVCSNIITDKRGFIVARNLDSSKLSEKLESLLK